MSDNNIFLLFIIVVIFPGISLFLAVIKHIRAYRESTKTPKEFFFTFNFAVTIVLLFIFLFLILNYLQVGSGRLSNGVVYCLPDISEKGMTRWLPSR